MHVSILIMAFSTCICIFDLIKSRGFKTPKRVLYARPAADVNREAERWDVPQVQCCFRWKLGFIWKPEEAVLCALMLKTFNWVALVVLSPFHPVSDLTARRRLPSSRYLSLPCSSQHCCFHQNISHGFFFFTFSQRLHVDVEHNKCPDERSHIYRLVPLIWYSNTPAHH